MITQNCFPDFITVGGAEGGTVAAPLDLPMVLECHLIQHLFLLTKRWFALGLETKSESFAVVKLFLDVPF